MKLSEYIRRMREIQAGMYDGRKPSVEELIELSRPQCLGLHLVTEQELEWMIEGINDGLDAIENAYLYFDDEEYEEEPLEPCVWCKPADYKVFEPDAKFCQYCGRSLT